MRRRIVKEYNTIKMAYTQQFSRYQTCHVTLPKTGLTTQAIELVPVMDPTVMKITNGNSVKCDQHDGSIITWWKNGNIQRDNTDGTCHVWLKLSIREPFTTHVNRGFCVHLLKNGETHIKCKKKTGLYYGPLTVPVDTVRGTYRQCYV